MSSVLRSVVTLDNISKGVAEVFDFNFSGEIITPIPSLPALPETWRIGLIVGPSGSGKSTLLRSLGDTSEISWRDDVCVASHFESIGEAVQKLSAVGLNSIPSWLKPFSVLSTGEKFRADLAMRLSSNALIDEFTSVVDRQVAKSCSMALRRYVNKESLSNIVLATCHYDVLPWLNPCWVFDTATSRLTVGRRSERPRIVVEVLPCSGKVWSAFSPHHYLSDSLNASSRCWLALWNNSPIGFTSAIAHPSGTVKNAWREHRTVVLPDYQGLGIGVRLSDALGEMFLEQGARFFSKTAHPRMGQYRDSSPLWRPTSKNRSKRLDYKSVTANMKEFNRAGKQASRFCWAHEYVGKQ
jgi:energy-coupling factor transporter ATP-binding protein EcfA2